MFGLFPYTCANCAACIDHAGLCQECWLKIRFISDCTDYRSCVVYNADTRNIITHLKRRLDYNKVQLLGNWMYQCTVDLTSQIDAIVPVPSHWLRLMMRGHNVPTYISQTLSQKMNKPVKELLSARYTVRQHGKNIEERRANVKDKFYLNCDLGPCRVLLVDDVITTGATLDSARSVLQDNGYQVVMCGAPMKVAVSV